MTTTYFPIPNGLTCSLNDKPVFGGVFKLIDANLYWPTSVVRPSVEKGSPIKLTQAWSFVDETAIGTFTLTNGSAQDLPLFTLEMPATTFDATADFGRCSTQQKSVQDKGTDLFHPSGGQPFGAWRFIQAGKGMSVCPLGLEETPKLLLRRTVGGPILLVCQNVPAGSTFTFKLAIVVTDTPTIERLWLPYRDSYRQRYSRSLHVGSLKPVAAAFALSQPQLVSPSNPEGYRASREGMLSRTRRCQEAGCGSLVVWDIAGQDPAGMLSPNWLPPISWAFLQDMVGACGRMNLLLGARCGKRLVGGKIVPQVDPSVPEGDFATALGMGVSGVYCDEGGERLIDLEIARRFRQLQVDRGIACPGFAEFPVDVLLPYIGAYTTWGYVGGGYGLTGRLSQADLDVFQWLMPGTTVYAQIKYVADADMPAAVRACVKAHIMPLLPWWDIDRLVPVAKAAIAEETDPNSNWWRL